ncbi:MAG: hypothetical protein E6J34_12040 [Chloroflexi bacterium]|nr:MAG: hypothetical protein E6J34_12040 [Chloroflexota bacterium]
MNLVSFSIKTKGAHNFIRRLWTVFTRFGISEAQTRRALHTLVSSLGCYDGSPTFFIPAVVLNRHPDLIAEIAKLGAEIGIHGYVHNDYRTLSKDQQYEQTKQAIAVFQKRNIAYEGFRNPYLGWTEESLTVFSSLDFSYDSNEAVIHDVIDLDSLTALLRSGFEKSLSLFQAVPCSAYRLRPHIEGKLLRVPTSIPDDEMLFDRLRMTDPVKVGYIWSKIMQRVYNLEGLYVLNLHPERAISCKDALATLLSSAHSHPLPVWVARLKDVAQWWKERSQFRWRITQVATNRWQVEAKCTPRATILARHLLIEDQSTTPWDGDDMWIQAHSFTVSAEQCPCLGLSLQTHEQVVDFLHEQGYPVVRCTEEDAYKYLLYIDMPEGLGENRKDQQQRCADLVDLIERQNAPFLRFGCWPDGKRATLSISGDIDSVTVQDFFLRILEVH